MGNYFDADDSIQSRFHDDVENILGTIAARYIGQNPPAPFTFRAFSQDGILNSEDKRYRIDLNDKIKESRNGQMSYACSKLWSGSEKQIHLSITCLGPIELYCNGTSTYKSTVLDEIESTNKAVEIPVFLKKGWNTFLVKCIKTASGFGCFIGTKSPKWLPLNFHSPFAERDGQSGWIYSVPVDRDVFDDVPVPIHNESEWRTGLEWYPKMNWGAAHAGKSALNRIYGDHATGVFFSWAKLNIAAHGTNQCLFAVETESPVEIWVDGILAYRHEGHGNFEFNIELCYGMHDVLVKSAVATQGKGDFTLRVTTSDSACSFVLPYPVKGIPGPWLYLGPFQSNFTFKEPSTIQTMYKVFEGIESKTYWRADAPMVFVRPFLENEYYGKWSYPLGVTLYGLLQTGRLLERKDIVEYVVNHVRMCADIHEYALWDQEVYGYPGVNHQLAGLEALDDCGSFGSLMLEAYEDAGGLSIVAVADLIAEHMSTRQERREEGAFYRNMPDGISENTLWADDLYMSVPFLCRYYRLTGQIEYIDDAARQFLLYKKYLYIPEYAVLSHVYDFKRDTATYIPWGRGNGWALFSLSEILAVLPENHSERQGLLDFFNELCRGYLSLQGVNGLWHQVITQPDAYEETSCTSMFIYSFARGIRFGWFPEEELSLYEDAVLKAWDGLTRISIDYSGNIHGVCRGSLYSFTAEYYKHELLWNLNDAHGIGIVMLAGIEVLKLKKQLSNGAP